MDAAQRHLELGVWCRDRGMTSQATAEFYLAVEVSERKHPGALRVLSFMKSLKEDCWKKSRKRPSQTTLDKYSRKAAKARQKDRKDRISLAALAWKKKMREEAEAEYEAILRERDDPLETDSKGRIKLEGSTIPAELSESFLAEAVAINEVLYLRDPFLDLLPNVDAIQQVESEALRVRSISPEEPVAEFHALGEALLPHLQEAQPGRPLVRLNLFVFSTRSDYEEYLTVTDNKDLRRVSGFAQSSNLTAVICTEDLGEDAVRALVLHELSHLHIHSMTRAKMPSWYSEGFAELFGGQGTFTWDGSKLKVGGLLADFCLTPLRKRDSRFTLDELFSSDALDLFATDRDRAFQFYAQSWAFLFYLRNVAEKEVQDKLLRWEDQCFGTAAGAKVADPDGGDPKPAQELFLSMVVEDHPLLEAEFHAWLDRLFLG